MVHTQGPGSHDVFFVPAQVIGPALRRLPCGPWRALAGFGQNFHIELGATLGRHAVDQAGQGRQMRHSGVFFGAAKPAVKVPEVGTFGQVAAPFALDVFADFVLDGLQNAVAVLAFNVELESFFSWAIVPPATDDL